MFYSAATALMYIFDVLSFCIGFYFFQKNDGHEHADIILLCITITFLLIDGYYFTWVLSLKAKVPPEMACYISDAILGYTKKMALELSFNLSPEQRAKERDARQAFTEQ